MLFKSLLFSLISCFSIPTLQAQSDTFYTDALYHEASQNNFKYKIVVTKTNEQLAHGECRDMNGKLIFDGEYKSYGKLVKHGMFLFYNADGRIITKNNYCQNNLCGEAFHYDDNGINLLEKRIYDASSNTYCFEKYDTSQAKVIEQGCFDQYNRKYGVWKMYCSVNGNLLSEGSFSEGKKIDWHKEYYCHGILKRKEFFDYGKLKHKAMFDELGKRATYYPAFQYPSRKESLSKYLFRKTNFYDILQPIDEVEISFLVSKQGEISQVEIKNFVHEACKKEMVIAILKMKKWKPAMIENRPIEMRYKQILKTNKGKD
jgi:antitoxin component YwqK of YwqJK toxin-antitoxin module